MRVNSKKMFLTLKKEASCETRQHQSYLELKKDVGEEFARKALLFNLRSLKNNVRATARAMKCSAHTVYLALEKQKKRNLKDSSHKPKSKHPRYIEEEKERMIIEYRKKTKLGKRRLRYYIFQKEGINIAESTIGKVIKRGIWWQKIYNLDRPHQGLGNLTPYEKLKSLGYVTGEEICLFPTLILDSVCCLDPFKIKTKSVQYHLDHDRSGNSCVTIPHTTS